MHELHWRLTQACPPGQSAFWLHCPTTHTPFAQTFPAPHEEDVTQASHEPPAHTVPALHAVDAAELAARVTTCTSRARVTSTTAQPAASTLQSEARATAAKP